MGFLIAALAPVVIIAVYVYFRDKYEKEPLKLLVLALLGGALAVIPIMFLEGFLMNVMPPMAKVGEAFTRPSWWPVSARSSSNTWPST